MDTPLGAIRRAPKTSRLLATGAILALSLGLAGCGSAGGSPKAAATKSASSSAAASQSAASSSAASVAAAQASASKAAEKAADKEKARLEREALAQKAKDTFKGMKEKVLPPKETENPVATSAPVTKPNAFVAVPSKAPVAQAPATKTPATSAPVTRAPLVKTPVKAMSPTKAPAFVVYANCKAVKAAGKAPIHRGDPGYGRHLDRDGDGKACES